MLAITRGQSQPNSFRMISSGTWDNRCVRHGTFPAAYRRDSDEIDFTYQSLTAATIRRPARQSHRDRLYPGHPG